MEAKSSALGVDKSYDAQLSDESTAVLTSEASAPAGLTRVDEPKLVDVFSANVAAGGLSPAVPLRAQFLRQLRNVMPLVATDFLVGGFCFVAANAVATLSTANFTQWMQLAFLLPALFISLAVMGVYPGIGISPIVELRRLALGTTTLMATLFAALMLGARPASGIVFFALTAWALLLVGLPLGRAMIRALLSLTSWWGEPVLILGGGAAGKRVYDALAKQSNRGMRPVGIVDPVHYRYDDEDDQQFDVYYDDEDDQQFDVYVGPPVEIPKMIARHHVMWAVIANPEGERLANLDAWQNCVNQIPNLLVEGENAVPSLWTESRECGNRPAFHVGERLAMRWPQTIKRALDLALIAVCGVALLPTMALLGLLVKWYSPKGSIFYGHERIGRGGRIFTAWKFRTMVPHADNLLAEALANDPELRQEWERDHKLKNDPRVIRGIGSLLRKTSLDELPQLWNVLCGEMSLVGPRPIVEAEIEKYKDDYSSYKLVRPGITGMWQVSGRNDTDYDERVQLDRYYVRNWSPWLDIYILARTIRTVLLREGAY
ncbi:MAG: undecaprenyl-phosphate galactose phosphotransferase WbaP [Aeoliella sp.]